MSSDNGPKAYGNWTIPRSTGIGGATVGTTLVGLALIVISLLAGMFVTWWAGAVTVAVSVIIMIPLLRARAGRSGYEAMLLRRQFKRAQRKGENVFRSGPFSRVPGGRYRLPGPLGGTKISEWETAGGQKFAMIHFPRQNQYTVILRAFAQGGEGVDQDRIDSMVWHWGATLSSFGQDGDVAGAEAVIENLPATGIPLNQEVRTLVKGEAPPLAQDIMVESAEQLGTQRVAMDLRLALSFTATTNERRKSAQEQSYEVSRRLMAMTPQLGLAGIRVRPMRIDEVVEFVHRAYTPSAQANLEFGRRAEGSHGVEWEDAGPASAVAHRRRYEHDGATSSVWEMQTPPRGAVTEQVLRNLVAPNGGSSRKRVNIVYRPHSAETAAQLVEQDYKNAHAAVDTGRAPALTKAQAKLRLSATEQARQEEARGHGLTRFGMLMTVTEDAENGDLPRAEGLLRALSVQSRLKVRRADYYQDLGFAAGLGVGVLLPDHASVPKLMGA